MHLRTCIVAENRIRKREREKWTNILLCHTVIMIAMMISGSIVVGVKNISSVIDINCYTWFNYNLLMCWSRKWSDREMTWFFISCLWINNKRIKRIYASNNSNPTSIALYEFISYLTFYYFFVYFQKKSV